MSLALAHGNRTAKVRSSQCRPFGATSASSGRSWVDVGYLILDEPRRQPMGAEMAKAKLIVIKVEDKPGTVAAAVAVLSAAKVNIETIFDYGPQGDLQLIVDDPRKAMKTGARRVVRGRASAYI